ncbi:MULTISPECIES: hypothetical protein [Nocardioides]|uniref:Lipoprotein n=1 Tax=Nocardioides vastitatis TaxID=2568655 RepID=A0ABW0ZDM8_9ACTN|nr:hypothetical protein [Nocardioides sp.]THI95945.1 hypothetical protein E7Z54_17885 [Nocardioides sp.]
MTRLRVVAAAAAALLATSACSPTVWPSAADQDEFCDVVTDTGLSREQLDELRSLGTPANLPFEARRYLLDLDEGEETDAADEATFREYVDGYCR